MNYAHVRLLKPQVKYSTLNLAFKVRAQTIALLYKFDRNNNQIFEQSQIIEALKTLIQADETELRYVTTNMFRYDKDNDGIINCKELANFFLEISWGEIAIQRLHRKGYYKNGSSRMIEVQEFYNTMKYILSFIKMQADLEEVGILFQDIDSNKDGLISYNEYFTFLRTYFGSQSEASNEQQVKVVKKPNLPSDLVIDLMDRFRRLVISQSKLIFIGYNVSHNLRFSKEEVKSLVQDLFSVLPINVEFLVQRITSGQILNDFQRLTNVLVMVQFGEIALAKMHNQGNISQWKNKSLTKQDFVKLMRAGCFYMNVLPDKELLFGLYNLINPNQTLISYSNYRSFVTKLFGASESDILLLKQDLIDPTGFSKIRINQAKTVALGSANRTIVSACWKQVQKIFKKYDVTDTGLSKTELQSVISQIFRSPNAHQKNILVWSALNFVDSNSIKLSDFIPWAFKKLFSNGFISFYSSDKAPKSLRMNVDQFKSLMRHTFWFIPSSLDKQLQNLYDEMNSNKENLLEREHIVNWITKSLTIKP